MTVARKLWTVLQMPYVIDDAKKVMLDFMGALRKRRVPEALVIRFAREAADKYAYHMRRGSKRDAMRYAGVERASELADLVRDGSFK